MLKKFGGIGGPLALVLPIALAASASAQDAPGAADRAFTQCSAIADPAARLACYDSAQPSRQSPAGSPTNRPGAPSHYPEFGGATQAPPPANPAPTRAFGSKGPDAPVRSNNLVASVASYSLSPSGRFTIILDNGQIWRQVDSDDGVAQFKKQGRNMVAISKGFLWSYDLKLNAMSAVFKVTRVK